MGKNSLQKNIHFGIMTKTCEKYGLKLHDYKNNPEKLYAVDPSFRAYIQKNFKYEDNIKWFNKHTSWKEMISRSDHTDWDDDHNKWTTNTAMETGTL